MYELSIWSNYLELTELNPTHKTYDLIYVKSMTRTLARDIMQLLKEEKIILKFLLSLGNRIASLTTDTQTQFKT